MGNLMTKKVFSWHDGEKTLQRSVDATTQMEAIGARAVRPFLPQQHRDFFPQLPFIVVGAVDKQGDPWASILCQRPGFVTSPTEVQLDIRALPSFGDPAVAGIATGANVGLLGIELHTRRRNRTNSAIDA